VVDGNAGPITGDETVPYHSLSWCKNWLGPKVNITMAPQVLFFSSSPYIDQTLSVLFWLCVDLPPICSF
jgi:hypothetical protein